VAWWFGLYLFGSIENRTTCFGNSFRQPGVVDLQKYGFVELFPSSDVKTLAGKKQFGPSHKMYLLFLGTRRTVINASTGGAFGRYAGAQMIKEIVAALG
jgi:hypothetical protein